MRLWLIIMIFLIWAVLYIANTPFGSVLIKADELLTLASVVFAVSILWFLGSLPGKDTSRDLYVSERVFYIDYKYV